MKVLVIGAAKTGTTVISKTIQASLPEAHYCLEPKDPAFFVCRTPHEHEVVKIIFEHWNQKPSFRAALVAGELPIRFDKIIYIVRDPRDELLSRLMYVAYPWAKAKMRPGEQSKLLAWISFIEQVEKAPLDYTFMGIVAQLETILGVRMLGDLEKIKRYANYIEQLPDSQFILRYEDFIDGQVSHLEAYLERPLSPSRAVDGVERTRRSATYGNWRAFFKTDDVATLQTKMGEAASQLGYDDWTIEPAATLEVDNYSQYLRRLLASFL